MEMDEYRNEKGYYRRRREKIVLINKSNKDIM
jgi:hypothetical protein